MSIMLVQGDITEQQVGAIVNAANSSLLGGGGVDGAIHRAGGPSILEECKAIRVRSGGCPTGEAVITTAGALSAQYVIHTVGPIWRGGDADEAMLLGNAYRNSLLLAAKHEVETIAFPSISTGAYRYPVRAAANVALLTCAQFLAEETCLREIRFVLFSADDLQVYQHL